MVVSSSIGRCLTNRTSSSTSLSAVTAISSVNTRIVLSRLHFTTNLKYSGDNITTSMMMPPSEQPIMLPVPNPSARIDAPVDTVSVVTLTTTDVPVAVVTTTVVTTIVFGDNDEIAVVMLYVVSKPTVVTVTTGCVVALASAVVTCVGGVGSVKRVGTSGVKTDGGVVVLLQFTLHSGGRVEPAPARGNHTHTKTETMKIEEVIVYLNRIAMYFNRLDFF